MCARAAAHRKSTRQKIAEWIREAKAVPCADCGGSWPYYVMQFDHTGDDKAFTIGRNGFSLAKVQAEAAKCDVVCANCHAVRTYERRRWDDRTPLPQSDHAVTGPGDSYG